MEVAVEKKEPPRRDFFKIRHTFPPKGLSRKEQRLVEANIPLVYHFASSLSRSRKRQFHEYDDLVQVGCLGLIRAAQKFDASRGYQFSTYASNWIKSMMGHFLTDNTTVRNKCRTTKAEIEKNRITMVRIDCMTDDPSYNKVISEPDSGSAVTSRIDVDEILGWLNPRERTAVESMMTDRTLESIGDELGISRERVRQIRSEAIGRIRHLLLCEERIREQRRRNGGKKRRVLPKDGKHGKTLVQLRKIGSFKKLDG